MLYSEFLEGINQPENIYTKSEYNRINAIYTESDTLTKEAAYKLYKQPDHVIIALLDELKNTSIEATTAAAKARKYKEESEAAAETIKDLESKIKALNSKLFRIENSAAALYSMTH